MNNVNMINASLAARIRINVLASETKSGFLIAEINTGGDYLKASKRDRTLYKIEDRILRTFVFVKREINFRSI